MSDSMADVLIKIAATGHPPEISGKSRYQIDDHVP